MATVAVEKVTMTTVAIDSVTKFYLSNWYVRILVGLGVDHDFSFSVLNYCLTFCTVNSVLLQI